jgi:DNA-binding NarL/FixJ family response regulator
MPDPEDERRTGVVVVDDHALFIRGLVRLLGERGVNVVGTARSGEEALEVVEALRPEVVLMDLNLPGMSGVEATRRLTRGHPGLCVVVLTVMAEEATLMEAILAGAAGYLLKDASIEEIVAGVRAAPGGGSLVAPELAGTLLRRIRRQRPEPAGRRSPLSDRERQVLALIVEGCDNAEIAAQLYISQNTVKNHVSAILTKLEVSNRLQAAVLAVRDSMI